MPVFILKGVICFVSDYLVSGLSSEIIMPSLFVEFVFFSSHDVTEILTQDWGIIWFEKPDQNLFFNSAGSVGHG